MMIEKLHPEQFPPINEWQDKVVTLWDYSRIVNGIQEDIGRNITGPNILHYLYLSLLQCQKCFSDVIPEDRVTMNSEVTLLLDDNKLKTIKIVFPHDVKEDTDISIYTPLGMACLGTKERSEIRYFDGKAYRSAVIKHIVFQPEKEKQYSL